MYDPTSIGARPGSRQYSVSTPSRPGTQPDTAASLWMDRKPQDFLRAMRKSMSEPQLGGGEGGAKAASSPGAAARPTGGRRRGENHAAAIIEAQRNADAAKRAADLESAERGADLARREHSRLVALRLKKVAGHAALASQVDANAVEVAKRDAEKEALVERLAAFRQEEKVIAEEVEVEEAATPRYEFMLKRTRREATAASDKCARPKREIEQLRGEMSRVGDSHLTAQLDAQSLRQAVTRFAGTQEARSGHNLSSLAQLRGECSEVEASKEAMSEVMGRVHNSSLALQGDLEESGERQLAEVKAPPRHAASRPPPPRRHAPRATRHAPRATPRHATPRHATPRSRAATRHATPRYAAPRHAATHAHTTSPLHAGPVAHRPHCALALRRSEPRRRDTGGERGRWRRGWCQWQEALLARAPERARRPLPEARPLFWRQGHGRPRH